MATDLEPIVGDWYSYRGRDFTVIDVDEDEGIVEIQYASGSVQQVDLNAWYDMDLEPSDEPEDWKENLQEAEEDAESARWEDEDEDEEEDEDEDDEDWDEEDEEAEDEWEGDFRDRRSGEDDSSDEH